MVFVRAARRFEGKYHKLVNNAFSSYGAFIAHKPLVPLVFGILLLGGLSFGLFRYEKETDLEKLWVEHSSRVVNERKFFNSRFGGTSRLEAVAIVGRKDVNSQIDLAHAMDGLTSAVVPLYDDISIDVNGHNLSQTDFCIRPLVPPTLKPGSTPFPSDGNWLSYGYQMVSDCALGLSGVPSQLRLPVGWGIDVLPCTKLSPLDCFKEGGDFDYPTALRQLETPIPGTNFTIVDIVAGILAKSQHCTMSLRSNLTKSFPLLSNETLDQIVNGVEITASQFYTWGYRWRKSYKSMDNAAILQHLNDAINFGAQMSPDPTDPQVKQCVAGRLPCCLAWFGLHIPVLSALGGVQYNDNSQISKITGVRWAQNNYHENHPLWSEYIVQRTGRNFSNDERTKLVKHWEQIMIDNLLPVHDGDGNSSFQSNGQFGDLQMEFNTWRSAQDIISDAAKTPIWQIILSVVLTSCYCFLAFVNFRKPVHSHAWVVLTGLGVVTLTILAGFGLTALIGIKFSPLAGSVVPFLTLGIGSDDIFVLVSIMRNYLADPRIQAMGRGSHVPELEMKLTLALAGPSVVLTTFSVLAAFLISSLNPMPISQWFCWQMGITATLHTLGLVLIFMPIMAIDARRVKARFNDPQLWFLFGMRSKKHGENVAPVDNDESSKQQLTEVDLMDPAFSENTGSTSISRWVAKYYAPLFESNIFKIIVVLVFAAFLACMIYLGFKKVKHGLKLSDVTLTGSYQNRFAELTEDSFPSYDVWIVTRNKDLPNEQQKILKIFDTVQNLTKWAPTQPRILEASFLGNMYLFAYSSFNDSTPLPPARFYSVEGPWSASGLGVLSLQDLWCEHNETKAHMSCFQTGVRDPHLRVAATKSVMFAQNLGSDTKPNTDMIKATRKAVDALNDEFGEDFAYMYGYPYLYYEQYLHSYKDLYLVVGLALVGVFMAVLIFQFSPTVSLLVVVVLLMVDLEVYGFMYILGAKLNALSLVNLGIVVGMCAEFTYISRSFLIVEGTRNYRVGKALEWTFEPLLHGFGTQVAATFPLLFVKYHAFKLYYFGMFTIMGILGFLNGFVLLPALLSWIGPPTLPHITEASALAQVDQASAVKSNGISEDHDYNMNGTNGHNGAGQ